jgi:hypothetical protein
MIADQSEHGSEIVAGIPEITNDLIKSFLENKRSLILKGQNHVRSGDVRAIKYESLDDVVLVECWCRSKMRRRNWYRVVVGLDDSSVKNSICSCQNERYISI